MSQQPYHYHNAGEESGGGTSAPPPPPTVVVHGAFVRGGEPYRYATNNDKSSSSSSSSHDASSWRQQQPPPPPSRTPAYYEAYYEHSGVGGGGVATTTIPGEYERAGEMQPRRCNDVAFAILFCVNLGITAGLAAMFAPRMIGEISSANSSHSSSSDAARDLMSSSSSSSSSSSDGGNRALFASWMADTARRFVLASLSASHSLSSFWSSSSPPSSSSIGPSASDYDDVRDLQEEDDVDGGGDVVAGTAGDLGGMILLIGSSTLIALLLSSGALGFMIRHAESLIKTALLFNVVCTAVFAIGAFFVSPFSAVVGIFLFVLTVYYSYVVWGRIPFAACNLVVATTAVKANLGLAIFAYSSLPVMFGWNCLWLVSFVSTVYVTSGCDATGNCASETSGMLVFSMLMSYHWTYQVIKNVLHVTVAGAVGTWWFVPDEGASFCSRGVRDSFVKSVTTSFGSICLGSLLVAIIEALRSMVRNARENGEGGILLCLAECLLSCLQDVLEYFNMWAFVFVGLYGYPFVEAGKNVMTLFQSRGWTTIITDNLAQGVLGLVSVAIGLITGLIAMAIANARGMVFGDEVGASAAAFFVGFIAGAVLAFTLLTLVSSAVNTVIVCYAEAPREFELNHPKLSQDMRSAWREAWPEEFRY